MCFTYLTWTLFTIAFPNFTFQYFQGRFIFSVFRSLTEVLCRWLLQLFHLHSKDADNSSLMWSTFSLSWWRTTGKLVYFLCWTFKVFLMYCFFHYSLRECPGKNYCGSCELILEQVYEIFVQKPEQNMIIIITIIIRGQ